MRVEEIAPRLLGLGTPVIYSHRAASVKRSISYEMPRTTPVGVGVLDLSGEPVRVHQPHGEIEKRDLPRRTPRGFRDEVGADKYGYFVPPRREQRGKVVELDRWVVVWPSEGEARIVGLTHRREGVWGTETDYYGDGYRESYNVLDETERWPLYEVRRTLTERPFLVPVWAACPVWDSLGHRRDPAWLSETNMLDGDPRRRYSDIPHAELATAAA